MPITDCISVDDIRSYKIDCQEVDLCCTANDITNELEIANSVVSIVTGTDWCPEEACKDFNGSGISKLFLTPVTSLPLLTLVSVADTSGCSVSVDFDQVVTRGHYLEFTNGDCFPCGSSNIQVCGLWGKSMPAAIKKSIILLALEGLSPGITGLATSTNVASATWEDFRISYKNDKMPDNIPSTGYREIDQLLLMYTNTANDISMLVVPQDDACTYRECGVSKKEPCCGNKSCGNC